MNPLKPFFLFMIFGLLLVAIFPIAEAIQGMPEIKGFSDEEIEGLLNGEGMGVAKVAELNHFPGPRHVLDLAEKLQLSDAQMEETQKIFTGMHKEAVRLGKMIIAKEEELGKIFAGKAIDSDQWKALVREIARLRGELRIVHLQAHLAMKGVLSPDQITKYDLLKGYGPKTREVPPHHHQKP